jgi:hypothetical protein
VGGPQAKLGWQAAPQEALGGPEHLPAMGANNDVKELEEMTG